MKFPGPTRRIRNGDIWNLLSAEGDRTPLARPRQKDIPIPARSRAHTPLGEAVSPTLVVGREAAIKLLERIFPLLSFGLIAETTI